MVPDGLVLLTSIAFIVGILALARKQALAKELASVELLARVDVLCLDKTGTITTGEIRYSDLVLIAADDGTEPDPDAVREALGAVAGCDPNPNATLAAIEAATTLPVGWDPDVVVPFSSARKWAASSFHGRGTWVLGAPEVVLGPDAAGPAADRVHAEIAHQAELGRRLVLLARTDAPLGETLPSGLVPVALVLLEDQIRPDAPEILDYFAAQDITLKVISGDHPATVAAVAARAGIPGAERCIDARQLPDDPDELAEVLDRYTVFGRVTPHQKRAMVGALQSRGHVVAMTGDGVNDVLALKDADMGIAMGAGSASTRAVAQLVLLDNSFATLPVVLAEGRRVINNIERVANLFVAKAGYAVILAALTGLLSVPFPFLPRHLTLVGTFSIGVPGFFLALEPNWRRATPGFVSRVVRFAIPSGVLAGVATFVAYEIARRTEGVELDQARTVAVCVLLGLGLYVLSMLCRPVNAFRAALLAGMAAGYVIAFLWSLPRDFFLLVHPPAGQWWTIVGVTVLSVAALELLPRVVPWWTSPSMFRTNIDDGVGPSAHQDETGPRGDPAPLED
jgi:cation-transporting ATPase E